MRKSLRTSRHKKNPYLLSTDIQIAVFLEINLQFLIDDNSLKTDNINPFPKNEKYVILGNGTFLLFGLQGIPDFL